MAKGQFLDDVQLTAGESIVGKVGIDQTIPGTTNGVQLLGSNLKWTPLSLINTDAGTEKNITVPNGKEYWVRHVRISFVATATVGSRNPDVYFSTSGVSRGIDDIVLPAVTAGQTKNGVLGVAYPNETAYSATDDLVRVCLPDIVLSAGDKIGFSEAQGIDRTNDTLKYYVRVLERNV